MLGIHDIEIIVLQDIEKSEKTAVDPTTSLFHQILMRFHGICFCNCIWNILQVILLFCLAINTQTKNSVLCQIHISLSVVFLLHLRVQDHLEITVL